MTGDSKTDGAMIGDLAAREKRVADKNYVSFVPQYTFSDTLEAQEAELSSNPLMLRLIASRRRYDDPHRPIYHYVNPEGRLNDPNGLCFWQGRRIFSTRPTLRKMLASIGATQ